MRRQRSKTFVDWEVIETGSYSGTVANVGAHEA